MTTARHETQAAQVTTEYLLGWLQEAVPSFVLLALVVLAAASGRSGTRVAFGLAGLSVLWLLVNSPVEGVTVVRFGPGRGLTGADLTGLAGLLIAASSVRRAARRRHRRDEAPDGAS